MAVFVSGMFWIYFYTVQGSGDLEAIMLFMYEYNYYSHMYAERIWMILMCIWTNEYFIKIDFKNKLKV